jgi:hypothetical protein
VGGIHAQGSNTMVEGAASFRNRESVAPLLVPQHPSKISYPSARQCPSQITPPLPTSPPPNTGLLHSGPPRKLSRAEIGHHRKVGAIILHAIRAQTQLVAVREIERQVSVQKRRIWVGKTGGMSTLVEVSCESGSIG